MEKFNIDPHKYSQLIFEGWKQFKGERLVFSTNDIGEIRCAK